MRAQIKIYFFKERNNKTKEDSPIVHLLLQNVVFVEIWGCQFGWNWPLAPGHNNSSQLFAI
jgi:hypothetical protein